MPYTNIRLTAAAKLIATADAGPPSTGSGRNDASQIRQRYGEPLTFPNAFSVRRTTVGPMAKKQQKPPKVSNKVYEAEIFRLQTELVKLQEWTRQTGARILVIFEGRDAAGKGGAIKRITEYLSPRIARIVALPTPTERERGQWYYQRYIAHLPSKGEIVLFDRSWYNRAGVEKVMGFCTQEEYDRFLQQTPIFEQMLIDDGVLLRKYWFSVSDSEQLRRFRSRHRDPVRRWKLSPMDVESINRWEDYSRAKGRDDGPHRYADQPLVCGGV